MYRIVLLAVLAVVSGCSRPAAPAAAATDNPAPTPSPQAESNLPAGGAQADASTAPDAIRPAGDAETAFDASYVAEDFCAVVVIRARLIAASQVVPASLLEQLNTSVDLDGTGIRGLQDIESITVLIDPAPGGDVAFRGGAIVRFTRPADLKPFLMRSWPDIQEQAFLGKTYYASSEAGIANVATAAFLADERTVLIAPEPTLQKMLIAKNSQSPLIEHWKATPTKGEATLILAVEPVRDFLDQVFSEPGASVLPPPLDQFQAIPTLADSVTATVDLQAEDLLTVRLEGKDDASATQLTQLAGVTLILVKSSLAQWQQDASQRLPPESVEAATGLLADIQQGLRVEREANRVMVALKKPANIEGRLPELLLLAEILSGPSEPFPQPEPFDAPEEPGEPPANSERE